MANKILSDEFKLPASLLTDRAIAMLTTNKSGSPAAIKSLLAKADEMLGERTEAVTEKKVLPPSGDKHDYMSLAVYVWPNPDTADGLPYIHKDGLVNPEIHDYDMPRMARMGQRAQTLALAALHSGKAAYADKATEVLRVWFIDDATRMNPHLDFGQFVPGECDGRCYGIIETFKILPVVNAVGILESLSDYQYTDGRKIRQWFGQYARWLLTSKLGIEESNTTNNHRSWHTLQSAGYLLFSGDSDAARDLLQRVVPDILEKQMADDGSMPRELARTRSFHYVTFVLIPLLMCADIGNELGLDLAAIQTESGSSIRHGMDWFYPYLTGKSKWTWQQIIEESPYEDVYPLLRLAANVLKEPAYEETLKKLTADQYDQLLQDLILPPVN